MRISSKAFLSIAVSLIMIFGLPMSISANSFSITGAPFEPYTKGYDHTAEWYFGERMQNGVLDELNLETVGDMDYIYIVKDGEAYIVNVHFGTRGIENRILNVPEKLGGYQVVAIGHPQVKPYVFWYISYGEDIADLSEYYSWIDSDSPYPECDPEVELVDKIVLPEGCRTIYENALYEYQGSFCFPKSLRLIENYHNQDITPSYITGVNSFLGENTFITPDCEFGTNFFYDHDLKCDNYICQSRFPSYTFDTSYSIPKAICVPYNVTEKQTENALFNSINLPKLADNTVIYCADDSPTYEVIQANKALGEYQVVTDIPKAEYIAFPSETVNVNVGEVMDLEAKTYPTDAIWTACDYEVSDPSIVKIDEYSGRITALKEGTVTVTATHCERGYVDTCTVNVTTKPEPGVNGIEPATDTPYVTYGNRDYKINVTGSPSKIQVVRDNGGTTTIDRRKATVTSNGDTETWIVNMRVEAGTHNIRAKYGKVWDDKLTPFTVKYDLPGAYSFDLTYENGIGNFNVFTDPEITKIQFALDNGCTLTYSQTNSYIGEDGLRHWEISRKIPSDTIFTLRTKYGYTWTDTNFEVNTIV